MAPFFYAILLSNLIFLPKKTDDNMPRQGDICQHFNRTLLKHYRKKKYKSRKDFASVIGVSERTAQAWELGEKKPSLRSLNKIANELEIDIEDILNETGKQIWLLWQGHLLDYVIAGPEEVKKTKVEVREGSALTGYDSNSTTITKRELKLTSKEAIELTEKLGIFEDAGDETDEGGQTIGDLFRKPKGGGD